MRHCEMRHCAMRQAVFVMLALLLLLLHAQALSLHPGPEEDDGGPRAGAVVRREGGRRTTRDRIRVGYMFGKRSGVIAQGLLHSTLGGKAVTEEQLTSALQRNPQLARQVARHLDRNGDGIITSSEVL